MKWHNINERWISENKEKLFFYFKVKVIPNFYSEKVFDTFKDLTLDDVVISGRGELNSGSVMIHTRSGGSQTSYYILYSHWRSSEWEGHYDNLGDYESDWLIKERDKKLGFLLD